MESDGPPRLSAAAGRRARLRSGADGRAAGRRPAGATRAGSRAGADRPVPDPADPRRRVGGRRPSWGRPRCATRCWPSSWCACSATCSCAGRPAGLAPAELPPSSNLYDTDREALARAHDPGWALAFIQRLVDHERGVMARLDQIEAGRAAPAGAVFGGGRGRGPRGPLPAARQRQRRDGRGRFLPAAAAVAAGDETPPLGAAVLDRRVRLRRAARERGRALAQRAGARRRRLRPEGALGRPAVLRSRTAERGDPAAARPADRRQRVDARRA